MRLESKGRVRLISWKPELARERARILKAACYTVHAQPFHPSGMIGQLRATPPHAVVIDLDRLPSHGREVAVAMRNAQATRYIPIVFAGGVEEKVERIRQELPDAVFASWEKIGAAVGKAMAKAPIEPVRPLAHMERYVKSTLVQKLGIKPGMQVALLGAPEEFEESLGEIPDGTGMQVRIGTKTALTLWFVRSRSELEGEIGFVGSRLPEGCPLWVIHPKQSGRYAVDFNQRDVRVAGLEAGLVDYKVCAVDTDWSGLKFARKKRRSNHVQTA